MFRFQLADPAPPGRAVAEKAPNVWPEKLQWYPVVGVILKFLRCAKMLAASVFLAVTCLSKL